MKETRDIRVDSLRLYIHGFQEQITLIFEDGNHSTGYPWRKRGFDREGRDKLLGAPEIM